MLSWLDVLKLLVPVLTALGVIWIRHWYERRSERRFLEHGLIRGFQHEPLDAIGALSFIQLLRQRVEKGEACVLHLRAPRVLLETAARLASLDPHRAYLYYDYVGIAEDLNMTDTLLSQLMQTYHISHDQLSPRLKTAIQLATTVMLKSHLNLDRRRLAIVQELAEHGLARPDPQFLAHLRQCVAQAETAIAASR